MNSNNRPTTEVNADVIRLLSDIKLEVQQTRQEGNTRGVLVEGAIAEIESRIDSFEDKFTTLEQMIQRVAANRQSLLNEFKRLKARIDIHDKAIDELKEAQVEKTRMVSDADLKHESDLAAAAVHIGKIEKRLNMKIEFKKDLLNEVRQTTLNAPTSVLFEPELGVHRAAALGTDPSQQQDKDDGKFAALKKRWGWF